MDEFNILLLVLLLHEKNKTNMSVNCEKLCHWVQAVLSSLVRTQLSLS